MRKHAATVFIDVRSVTVAEPPRINIAISVSHNHRDQPRGVLTRDDDVGRESKECKDYVRDGTPSSLDDFEEAVRPSVCTRETLSSLTHV